MKYLIKKPDTFLNALNDDINSILHRSFDNLFPEYIFEKESLGMAMPVDVKENDDSYKLKVELPGIKKDDIAIDVNKNSIKIEANKESEKEEKHHKYHKSEFRFGEYSRTIYFPQTINVEKVNAELKHGILKIDLPKAHEYKEEVQKVNIKEG